MFFLSHSGYDYSQKRCVDASQWFMNQYLPRHNVDVNVHHCRLEKRENVYGWAWTVDCDYRPREFNIEIHNHRMEEKLYREYISNSSYSY